MAESVSFKPVKIQWPEEATAWLNDLNPLQGKIAEQQQATLAKIDALAGLVNYQPSEIAKQAAAVIETAEQNLTHQFNSAPYCLTVTPFQMGVGSGTGYNKYLSAPNLINHIIKKLNDGGDSGRPTGDNLDCLMVLFLSTHFRQLSDLLAVFNSLLNIQELEVAQRRADFIDKLEETRQIIPSAGTLPNWQGLDMAKLNIVSQIKNGLTAQVANLQSYTSGSPIEKLKELLAMKQSQEEEQAKTLADLKENLAKQSDNAQMQALYIEGGNIADIIKAIKSTQAPDYDWPLCAGVCFVGEPQSLAFIKEVVNL